MKFGATLLLISFIAIGVFGFLAMGSADEGAHRGCIAATAASTSCPNEKKGIPFIEFHIGAFKKFSSATIGNSSITALMLVSVLLAFFATLLPSLTHLAFFRFSSSRTRRPFRVPQKLSRWISRHEKCDLLLAA